MTPITYRSTHVNGLKVFYRQAGHPGAPKLLLLHGYPSASHMFRDLIPQLSDRFHVVAPDLPRPTATPSAPCSSPKQRSGSTRTESPIRR
jgi:pimeloyl-ACP methyl ester carboxylesterase